MDYPNIGIRVLVKDFPACYDFYTQKLGMEPLWGDREGPFASFKANGSDNPVFSMFLAELQTMYEGYIPPKITGKVDNAIFIIPTDDVDRDHEELSQKGVEFFGKPQTIPEWYMRCVYFRDPEGNLFELSQGINE